MPIKDLHQVAQLSPDLSVEVISDYVIVLRDQPNRTIYIIPMSEIPVEHPIEAATFTFPEAPWFLFFLDNTTLCFLESYYVDDASCGIKLIRIRASDCEFTNTSREEQDLPVLRAWDIMRIKCLPFSVESTRKIILRLQPDKWSWHLRDLSGIIADDPFQNQKTTITITAASATCDDLIPLDESKQQMQRTPESQAGDIVVRYGNMFYDTGHSLMNWMEFDGFKRTCCVWERWLTKTSNGKLSLFDAYERSNIPFAEIEISHDDDLHRIRVSQGGVGIITAGGKIHKFTVTAFCQPLELLAAMVTFDQLPEEMRDEINETGPYDFRSFMNVCYDDS